MTEGDELLTVDEVAGRVKVNPETVRRWIKSGRLPAARPARGPYRIHSADLDRLFGTAPKAPAPTSSQPAAEAPGEERRALRDFKNTIVVAKELARIWREEPIPAGTITKLERRLAIGGVRVALTDAGRRYAEAHGQALPDSVHVEADEALLALEMALGDSRSISEQLEELIEAQDTVEVRDTPNVEAYGAFIQEEFQKALAKGAASRG